MTRQVLDSSDETAWTAIIAQAERSHAHGVLATPFGTVTHEDLIGTALDIAASLRQYYPGAVSSLIIVMAGDPSTVAALLAAGLVGRTAVLLPASSTAHDIWRVSVASRAELVLQYAGAPVRIEEQVAVVESHLGLSWTDLPTGAAPTAHERIGLRTPTGFLCHRTSGTSGSSRLAVRSGTAVLVEMESLRHALGMTDADVILCGSAVSHSYGCVGGLLTPLLAGASLRIARSPTEALAAMGECEPSILFGLGPMYAQWAEGTHDVKRALRDVRLAFSAGAALPAGLFEQFQRRFGVPIRQDYGTSETGTISLDLEPTPEPGTVGTPLRHVEVRLLPPAGIPLKFQEAGEIGVRSPAMAAGYFSAGTLVPCVDDQGWYGTRDAGSWVDGRLRLHRRLREFPSINGELVDLDLVDRAIAAMPGVSEVVVSAEVQNGRTRLVAMVATSDLTVTDLLTRCSQHLPKNWVPDHFVICDRLPRSPAGKILNKYV
jgi:long-chain acyl-CoA synthetase